MAMPMTGADRTGGSPAIRGEVFCCLRCGTALSQAPPTERMGFDVFSLKIIIALRLLATSESSSFPSKQLIH